MTNKVFKAKCVFCKKDLSKLKFRIDYILMPWRDDPDDVESLNKIAETMHPKCLEKFVFLNFNELKQILIEIADESK